MSTEVSGLDVDFWKLLHVFQNKVRVETIKLLLRLEWCSLSDIAKRLKNECGLSITLPGLLKHMEELERAGIVRHESGIFAEKPDARKTIYILEGKERVEDVLSYLENYVKNRLVAGVIFNETAKLARKIQGMGSRVDKKEKARFDRLLHECNSEKVRVYLTEDEKKKLKLWRMMMDTLL